MQESQYKKGLEWAVTSVHLLNFFLAINSHYVSDRYSALH